MNKIMCELQKRHLLVLLLGVVRVSYEVVNNVTEHGNETDISLVTMHFMSDEPKFASESSPEDLDELVQGVGNKDSNMDVNSSMVMKTFLSVLNHLRRTKETKNLDGQQATAMRNSENQDSSESDEKKLSTVISDFSANNNSPNIPNQGPQSSSDVDPEPSNKILHYIVETDKKKDEGSITPSMKGLSSISSNLLHGAKKVMEYCNCMDYKLAGDPATSYRHIRATSMEYGDRESMPFEDEDKEPFKFLPLIGPESLGNIFRFFEELKENIIVLLKNEDLIKFYKETIERDNDFPDEMSADEDLEKTGRSSKKDWKSNHAARRYYDYSTKSNIAGSQKKFLQRANNHNPFWLYTRLGLGKRKN